MSSPPFVDHEAPNSGYASVYDCASDQHSIVDGAGIVDSFATYASAYTATAGDGVAPNVYFPCAAGCDCSDCGRNGCLLWDQYSYDQNLDILTGFSYRAVTDMNMEIPFWGPSG